jgi:FlaG/FlaF family flagellin (archaellin)
MRQRIRSHLTFANVVSLAALFVALGGTTYAATGGNFILGHSNSASSKTSLAAPISDKALQVTNSSTGTGATALGLKVATGHPPFTVNSDTEVPNLNAAKLDGKNAAAFQAKGDSVPMQASLNVGQSSFWDVGQYVRLTADDTYSNGTNHCTLTLLNNAPGIGYWFVGDVISGSDNGGIQSGQDGVVTQAAYPQQPNAKSFHRATLIWEDNTGEVISVNYALNAYTNYCAIAGTATRAT